MKFHGTMYWGKWRAHKVDYVSLKVVTPEVGLNGDIKVQKTWIQILVLSLTS